MRVTFDACFGQVHDRYVAAAFVNRVRPAAGDPQALMPAFLFFGISVVRSHKIAVVDNNGKFCIRS